MKKIILIAVIILLCLIIIAVNANRDIIYFVVGGPGLHMPSEKKADKLLSQNYETLLPVAEAMLDIDADYVRWDTYDEKREHLFLISGEKDGVEFENTESADAYGLAEYMDRIKENKITAVTGKDNIVSFALWSSMSQFVHLVYCKDGVPEFNNLGENYIEPLSTENWYYYRNVFD